FSFNAFGELKEVIDAKGQKTSVDYDGLGRAVRTTSPEGIIDSVWDTAPMGIGKLDHIDGPREGGRERLSYDALGRLEGTFKRVPTAFGLEMFELTRQYDAIGRLKGITYPDTGGGFRVSFGYDEERIGLVDNPDTGDVYWRQTGGDAAGRTTQEVLA